MQNRTKREKHPKNITAPPAVTVGEKYFPIYQKTLEQYENDHPYWRIEVLVSLIQWSLKSLKHYIEDVRDPQITWKSPLVELHYPIDWNWKERVAGDIAPGGHIFGHLTRENTATRKRAVKTMSQMMACQFNAMTMADLTNWAWFEKIKSYYSPVFPIETTVALNGIKNKGKRREYFDELVSPFSIGAARIDLDVSKLKSGARIPKRAIQQLGQMDISGIRFSGDVNGRKFDMRLVLEIHPLIADYDQEKAYHPVVAGLAILNGQLVDGEFVQETPADWRKKDRREFWEGLLREIGKLPDQFVPKKQSEESVIIQVNSTLKIPAEHWKPENRSSEIKKVADALAKIGEIGEIQVKSDKGFERRDVCPVCGWLHDAGFTQIKTVHDGVIMLGGRLPDIVALIHQAHEKGFFGLSSKDEKLLKVCGGYRNACKAFDDLKHPDDYKKLFDTRKRGFISLRGAVEINRNKSEPNPE